MKVIKTVLLFARFFITSDIVLCFDKFFSFDNSLVFPVSSQTEAGEGGCLRFTRESENMYNFFLTLGPGR